MPSDSFIVVFATTRAFLLARRSIPESIPFRTVNTPRELTEQCGMCLLFANELRPAVEKILIPSRADLLYIQL